MSTLWSSWPMKDHYFDLHPCTHCKKHARSLDRCFILKKLARVKIHFRWIASWWWSSTTRNLYQSYFRVHSRVMTHPAVDTFFSPHIIPNKGEMTIDNQKQASENKWSCIRSKALILIHLAILGATTKVRLQFRVVVATAIRATTFRSMIMHLVEYIIFC